MSHEFGKRASNQILVQTVYVHKIYTTHSELAVHKLVALWHGQWPETAYYPSRTNSMGFRWACTVSQFSHFKLNIIIISNLVKVMN